MEEKMKNSKIARLFASVLFMFALPVFAISGAKFITPAVKDGKISISKAELSNHPLYVNYDSKGIAVQLIAVKASDNSARVSLNTCQSCNPSPRAFFLEKNGRLVCQNCGNVFKMDSVGTPSFGCNPMSIPYEVSGNSVTVKTSDLDSFAGKFKNWKGPVK